MHLPPVKSGCESHRIIAGEKIHNPHDSGFVPRHGFHGSHGTLEFRQEKPEHGPLGMLESEIAAHSFTEAIVHVPKEHRGIGIGTGLLKHAETVAEKLGHDFIWGKACGDSPEERGMFDKMFRESGWEPWAGPKTTAR